MDRINAKPGCQTIDTVKPLPPREAEADHPLAQHRRMRFGHGGDQIA
jgi:hypothetical protein